MDGQVFISFRAFLFGDGAAAAAEQAQPAWQAFLDERFSMAEVS
jgi:hypothetical protein